MIEAVNGEAALSLVQQEEVDLVLMDIQMPVMDGLEATRRIRALADAPERRRYAELPILAMTALAMTSDAEKTRAAGMNDHITKPIDPERLMTAIAHWAPAERHGTGPTASPLPGTGAPAALPEDLAALTTIDAVEGVRRIGGQVAAYRRQLSRFREHYSSAVDTLRQRLTESNAVAEAYCHALKGVAGNLGAHPLFALLTQIDQGLKQDERPDEDTLAALETQFAAVMDDIASLAPPTPPADPAATTPLTERDLDAQLDQLDAALELDIGAAEPLLAALRAGTRGTELERTIDEIAAHIDLFEIDEAVVAIERLRTRLAERGSA